MNEIIDRAIVKRLIDEVVCDPNLPAVPRFMMKARIRRAAKRGDLNAQRFVLLCELNTEIATRH